VFEMDEKFAKWKGMPREEVSWAPVVDLAKCTGCGMCFTSCGRNVYDFDAGKKKAVVARPLQCQVGCTTCKVTCVFEAISFPDPDYVRDLIRKKGILAAVKKELETKLNGGKK
jgi:NAD-dependent dihydropyrimidine dehydrogenase PreA subunit